MTSGLNTVARFSFARGFLKALLPLVFLSFAGALYASSVTLNDVSRAGDELSEATLSPAPITEDECFATENAPPLGEAIVQTNENTIDVLFDTMIIDTSARPFYAFELPLIKIPINGEWRPITMKITNHVVLMWIAAALAILTMLYLARKLKDPLKRPTRLQALFEIVIDYTRREALEPSLGKDGANYLPFCLTVFFFILYMNLIGLIPEIPLPGGSHLGGAATSNLGVTLALALMAILAIVIAGMAKKGPIRYWIELVPKGVPWPLWPFLFAIELIGLFSKALALTIRLFANMLGGHIVIAIVLFLVILFKNVFIAPLTIAFGVFMTALEILVAFLQAYVFMFLTAIFIAEARGAEER